MQGNQQVKFSELFKDTLQAFGLSEAQGYYLRHGMHNWEFWFWVRSVTGSTTHLGLT